jgi:hypothetical protein
MIRTESDIRTFHSYSIFLILILFSGFMIFRKSDYSKPESNSNPAPIEIIILQSNATVTTGIQINRFQKNWISNKDNFRLLTFVQTQFLNNKKVDQRIILLDKIRKKSPKVLFLIIKDHISLQEESELPVLS